MFQVDTKTKKMLALLSLEKIETCRVRQRRFFSLVSQGGSTVVII